MAKMGRLPKFDQDKLGQLEELMRLQPTLADTASFFKCGERTVEETIRKHFNLTFREFREQRMVHTRLNLIRAATKAALSGNNNVMLIFCLKNLCKWADRQENIEGKVEPFEFASQPDPK